MILFSRTAAFPWFQNKNTSECSSFMTSARTRKRNTALTGHCKRARSVRLFRVTAWRCGSVRTLKGVVPADRHRTPTTHKHGHANTPAMRTKTQQHDVGHRKRARALRSVRLFRVTAWRCGSVRTPQRVGPAGRLRTPTHTTHTDVGTTDHGPRSHQCTFPFVLLIPSCVAADFEDKFAGALCYLDQEQPQQTVPQMGHS